MLGHRGGHCRTLQGATVVIHSQPAKIFLIMILEDPVQNIDVCGGNVPAYLLTDELVHDQE